MQLLINALIAGSLAALIAGGLALVYGVLGVFNMALGQIVLFGGYITWWLHQTAGAPLSVSILGGLLGGVAITWFTFEVFINPFYKHHRFLPLVTTIALSMIIDAVLLLLYGEQPKSILPGMKDSLSLPFDLVLSVEQAVLIAITIFCLCAFAYIFHSTSFGRKIRAVVQHDNAALSLGISAPLLHRFVFVLSGVFAAGGGIFIGIDQNLTPSWGFPITIKAYAAVIAGGKGNVWGAVVAAYSIALLEQLAIGIPFPVVGYISAGFQQTVALVVIIVFLIFRPQGIFGVSSRSA